MRTRTVCLELDAGPHQLSHVSGLPYSIVYKLMIESKTCPHDPWIRVETCMKDGEYRFQFDWLSTPTSIDDEMPISIIPNHVFDLQGRHLPDSERSNGRMPKGIYIRDGRKVIR